ncbi:Fusaric acid resistance protein-like-domain-containing protein [Dichotomocladium elegans]|nr:Fusaric acid resistance protein-like-domain-containing protein [Dichotomocladium elegans]
MSAKRLPRNAAPIPFPVPTRSAQNSTYLSTSPASFLNEPPQSLSQWSDQVSDIPTRSPSSYSEIEVVLDDGTLQKRTVSLSTIPEPLPEHSDFLSDTAEEEEDDGKRNELLRPSAGSNGCDTEPRETTPLLRGNKTTYSGVSEASRSSASSSTTESDSDDTPFFPRRKSKQHSGETTTAAAGMPAFKKVKPDSYWQQLRRRYSDWTFTTAHRQVLKCSFAYLIGSLFTFIPAFNALIGNNRVSSHLVATATVFFNPAKSLGGMVEAAAFGWGYVLFALTVSLGSMLTTDYFIDRGQMTLAHVSSLLFWLVGATLVIAFLKAHWNKPPVATASSLCFIIIFIIVVREGSANRGDFETTRVEQIVSAVATGTLITVSCCIVFWPYSAARKLNKDLEATLSSYQVLLKLLTKTFLLDDDLPEFKANKTLQTAIESHRTSFTSLQKSLSEARLEVAWNSQIRGRVEEYEGIIKSMQRLAQYVGGLRSSCGIQFERMTNEQEGKGLRRAKDRLKSSSMSKQRRKRHGETWSIRPGYRRRMLENEMRRQKTIDDGEHHQHDSIIAAAPMERTHSYSYSDHQSEGENDAENTTLLDFIRTIRQPLKALAYTCKQTLYHLRSSFTSPALCERKQSPSYHTLTQNLEKAIALFEESQLQAAQKSYKHRMKKRSGDTALTELPGEDLYLVYFFVYNLIEFAREMISLVEAIERWSDAGERSRHRHWWQWRYTRKERTQGRDPSIATFVPNERNLMNTLHTPSPTTRWRRFFIRVWRIFSLFKLQKVRYAVKAAIAATLLATPAFITSTGDWFRTWRMEWALITLMVVMTPTVGGTNQVAIYRIFSTILGCCTAVVFYLLFPGNIVMLPLLTWLFSIPNFWLILHHKHGKFGQFTLLAYNLVMLNKYNDREANTIEVWRLAFQRCVAILVGVVFGLIATAYVWPYEARVELRKGLSDFLLRLAWLYQKLVSVYSERPSHAASVVHGSTILPSTGMAMSASKGRIAAKQAFMDMELELQRTLINLQTLLSQTPNEPRLKGAFPVETYRTMLSSSQNIVDKFGTMRTVIFKDAWFEDIQRDFIIPVNQERREMVGNVLLYFYLLASALRLKTPLPPYFPPARNAWQNLINRLRRLPVVVQAHNMSEKEHVYVLYYAYVTMMEDIIRELDKVNCILGGCWVSRQPYTEKTSIASSGIRWAVCLASWSLQRNGIDSSSSKNKGVRRDGMCSSLMYFK